MVEVSLWPVTLSFFINFLLVNTINFFYPSLLGLTFSPKYFLFIAVIIIIDIVKGWFTDIISESVLRGYYTLIVQKILTSGMVLFLASEAMFFFGFFWSFFHYSLNPSIHTGGVWPTYGIIPVNPFYLPMLNTVTLVLSGIYATASHFHLASGIGGPITSKTNFFAGNLFLIGLKETLMVSISLGIIFIGTQGYEFSVADFNITDSVYGSIFYLLTGFHGLHVIIGVVFLMVSLWRSIKNQFFYETHLGFKFSVWYWHFVDIIWILVYLFVYVWGSF